MTRGVPSIVVLAAIVLLALLDGARAQATATAEVRNYRRLVADALASAQRATTPAAPAASLVPGARPPRAFLPGPFEAGPLRVAQAPQPGDYAVCVRSFAQGRTTYLAAFITAGEVEHIRRAVGIDRCWLETGYAALPAPTPPKRSTRRVDPADAAAPPAPARPPRKPLGKR
ncbi:MAG: hypothetical protein AB7O50_09385 [Pseudolabrys sp.]